MFSLSVFTLKQGILLLWAIWLSMVTVMNIIEALKAAKLLPSSVKASANWTLMLRITDVYKTPIWINAVMFAGVIVWEAVASVLLWSAFFTRNIDTATTSLILCIALWGAFILVNQFFLVFNTEPAVATVHRDLFVVFVVSLLAIRLL
ncbi:MAG: hypothetical protein ACRCYY_19030 [Trueperaceae bacterium]